MDYFQVIVENLTYLIGLIASGIITALLIWFRAYAKKKWNLNLSDQQFTAIAGLAEQGVDYAEEKANQWAASGERSDGAKKMDAALEFVNAQVKELKLDTMARDALVKLIEAQLPKKRK